MAQAWLRGIRGQGTEVRQIREIGCSASGCPWSLGVPGILHLFWPSSITGNFSSLFFIPIHVSAWGSRDIHAVWTENSGLCRGGRWLSDRGLTRCAQCAGQTECMKRFA